ncbi:hypothetical protein NE237_001663 [Protea cynaroides]|uniref:Uncharacterized protein n=1 Tax=Protea cynaroides TaxID=273540 RepID=A0A9Q0QYL0_9MAGN|nr:hypothetical protein NE237_001663 [Protea cynaroides]
MIDVTGPTSLALADSSSSTSSDSSDSSSTSSSNMSVYMEGLEEFVMEGGTQESLDDVMLNERDGVQSQLKSKEQELDLMMVGLRPEVERLKKSLDDEKVIHGKLRSIAEVSRTRAKKYKEAFGKAKSLVVGVVRVYKKFPAFKMLVGKQSLPSFQYGVETLKEYVDKRVPGIDYTEADFLKLMKINEEPDDEDDQEIYCQLEQVFDSKVPPSSPSMSEVDSHGGLLLLHRLGFRRSLGFPSLPMVVLTSLPII